MIKTKIKQVSYERLESDPHGYNNTRIGMVADIEKNENPVSVLNELKVLVDGRHDAYREVRESQRKIIVIENRLSHFETNLHQIKLNDDQVESIDKLKKNILDAKIEIQQLHKRINSIM